MGRLRQAFIVLHWITQGATRQAIWGLSFLTGRGEQRVFLFLRPSELVLKIGSKGMAQRAVSEVKHPTALCFDERGYVARKDHF